MGDIFVPEDVSSLLHNKFIVVLGDSIQRGVYRDLVCLLQRNAFLTASALRGKGEVSFMGDELIEGGCKGEMHNGKHYREVRQYQTDTHLIRYYYITRCYSEYVESVLDDLMEEPIPDVIVMNSCIWDLTRYGQGRCQYPANLQRLFHRITHTLPSTTLVLWLTAMPLGAHVRGGVFLEHLQFFEATIRYDVAEANYAAYQVACDYDIDVLDLHYYFRTLTHLRVKDGIHWNFTAHRKISNLILSHICEAWGVPLPRRWLHQEPARQPTMHHSPLDENVVRYGGPIMRPAYMNGYDGNIPRRRHARSDSCQPSMLFSNAHVGYNNHFAASAHLQGPTISSCVQIRAGAHVPPYDFQPYAPHSFQGPAVRVARNAYYHPYNR